MKKITSRDNPLFKSLVKLTSSAKERRKTGKTVIDGIHLLSAAVQSGSIIDAVVIRESSLQHPEIQELLPQLPQAYLFSDSLFSAVSTVDTPSGILAVMPILPPKNGTGSAVFLDSIQDPGNLGSILRSAAASGIPLAYLSPQCADAWSPRVLRAAMGAHFCIAIHEHADLPTEVRLFAGKTVALALDDSQSLFDLDLKGQVGFIVGNEGAGISPAILALATERARIPMPGKIESLNAAAAAAISFFERLRQLS